MKVPFLLACMTSGLLFAVSNVFCGSTSRSESFDDSGSMVQQLSGSLYTNDGSLYSDPYPPQQYNDSSGTQRHYESSGSITSSGSRHSSSGGQYSIHGKPVLRHHGNSYENY